MAVLASGWLTVSLLHCGDNCVLVYRATTVGNVVPTRCATTGACRVQLLVRANAARVNELNVNYEGVLAGTGVASCSSRGIQPSLARIPFSHRPEPHVSGGAVSTALVRRQRNRPGFAAAKTPGVWGSIVGVSRQTPSTGSHCKAKLERKGCPVRFTPAAASAGINLPRCSEISTSIPPMRRASVCDSSCGRARSAPVKHVS